MADDTFVEEGEAIRLSHFVAQYSIRLLEFLCMSLVPLMD